MSRPISGMQNTSLLRQRMDGSMGMVTAHSDQTQLLLVRKRPRYSLVLSSCQSSLELLHHLTTFQIPVSSYHISKHSNQRRLSMEKQIPLLIQMRISSVRKLPVSSIRHSLDEDSAQKNKTSDWRFYCESIIRCC